MLLKLQRYLLKNTLPSIHIILMLSLNPHRSREDHLWGLTFAMLPMCSPWRFPCCWESCTSKSKARACQHSLHKGSCPALLHKPSPCQKSTSVAGPLPPALPADRLWADLGLMSPSWCWQGLPAEQSSLRCCCVPEQLLCMVVAAHTPPCLPTSQGTRHTGLAASYRE